MLEKVDKGTYPVGYTPLEIVAKGSDLLLNFKQN